VLPGVIAATATGLLLWTFVILPLWRRRSPSYVVLLETIIVGAIVSTAALVVLGPMPQTCRPGFPASRSISKAIVAWIRFSRT